MASHPTQPPAPSGNSQPVSGQTHPASSHGQGQPGQQGKGFGKNKGVVPRKPIEDPGPVKERVGQLRNPSDQRSKFEDMPGQQIAGEPATPGHAEDRQHLRGRTVADGSAMEDKDPKPKGVPKGAIMPGAQGTENPDAPPLETPEGPSAA